MPLSRFNWGDRDREPGSFLGHPYVGLYSLSSSHGIAGDSVKTAGSRSATPLHQDFASASQEGDVLMACASEPKPPRNRDQELPKRRGESIDDDDDKKPERDKVPDSPPTEPEPVPVKEPPPQEKRGPFVVRSADAHTFDRAENNGA